MAVLFISEIFAISGTVRTACEEEVPWYVVWVNGSSIISFFDDSFYVSKDKIKDQKTEIAKTMSFSNPNQAAAKLNAAKPIFFSLNGKKVPSENRLPNGVWIIKYPNNNTQTRVVFDEKRGKNFAPPPRTPSYLAKTATKDTVYNIEFRSQDYTAQFTVSNFDTVLNVKLQPARETFISEVRRDETSYYLIAKDTSGTCGFYLFRDGKEVKQVVNCRKDFKVRVLESGSYTAKFRQRYWADNKQYLLSPYPCNPYGWDSLAFKIDQPKNDEKLKLSISDDPTGFGKIAQYEVFDSIGTPVEKTVFLRRTSALPIVLHKPFYDSKFIDTVVTIGDSPHSGYDIFRFGNPAGRKVLSIYSYDCALRVVKGIDSGAYRPEELMILPKSDFLSRDSIDTAKYHLIPKEKISMETHDFYFLVVRTAGGFFPAICSLPDSANLFFFYGHGSRNCINMNLDKKEAIGLEQLLSINSDTVNLLRGKFAGDCLGYFSSCSIAEGYQLPDNSFAEAFSFIFKLPLYGSTTLVEGMGIEQEVARGNFRLITPDMYKE